MQRTHKIRIYPNKEQEQILIQTVGTARYVYNWALSEWGKWYDDFKAGLRADKPSAFSLSRKWTLERPEWALLTSRAPQTKSILNLGAAYVKFFKGQAERPVFKKKGACSDSFYMDNAHARLTATHLYLPKLGGIRLAESLRLSGKVMSYTISTQAGRWFAAAQVEMPDRQIPTSSVVVGVDVGMKTPATASNGLALHLPAGLPRLDKKLRRAQRRVSRKQARSKNRAKALRRKQVIQQRISNIRQDSIHKYTAAVTKNQGTVVVETLNIAGMHRSPLKNVRSGYQRSCMAEVLNQLAYKANRLVEANRFFPSTQLCSCCGGRKKMKLTERIYSCEVCGSVLDRDLNAAINLEKYVGAVSPDIKPVEGGVHSRSSLQLSAAL